MTGVKTVFVTDYEGRQNYVAGIFSDAKAAEDYRKLKPEDVPALILHVNADYPIYCVEFEGYQFGFFHDEDVARDRPNKVILFHIYEDYVPSTPWTDEMGRLDHEHFDTTRDEDDSDYDPGRDT